MTLTRLRNVGLCCMSLFVHVMSLFVHVNGLTHIVDGNLNEMHHNPLAAKHVALDGAMGESTVDPTLQLQGATNDHSVGQPALIFFDCPLIGIVERRGLWLSQTARKL